MDWHRGQGSRRNAWTDGRDRGGGSEGYLPRLGELLGGGGDDQVEFQPVSFSPESAQKSS